MAAAPGSLMTSMSTMPLAYIDKFICQCARDRRPRAFAAPTDEAMGGEPRKGHHRQRRSLAAALGHLREHSGCAGPVPDTPESRGNRCSGEDFTLVPLLGSAGSVERPVRTVSTSMPAWRGARLLAPALLRATRSGVVALLCRPLGQRAGAGGIAELRMPRLLERDQRVHRTRLPQLGEFDRVIKKAIRTTEWNVRVLRQHIGDQERRVVVPL